MGKKGDKLSKDSDLAVNLLIEKLESIKGLSNKRMFGGYGVFHEGRMFSIVDSSGQCYLKVDDSSRSAFEEKDSQKHSRMPYFSIPETIFNDPDLLVAWAKTSIELSK